MKAKVIYPQLMKYTNRKGSFRATFTNVKLNNVHPYINSYKDTPSILLQDLYSIEDNEYISRYLWVNWNNSWKNQSPQPGDIFEFNCNSISYFAGRDQQIFRLVYPTNIECICYGYY